jgi:dihydrofolate reductase
MTTGHPVIMGRRTYESVGKPLPNRRNILVSGSVSVAPAGFELVASLEAALTLVPTGDCFIVGGSRVYAEALPYASVLDLTRIDADVEGDTYFPQVDWENWKLVEERRESDPVAGLGFAFCTYHRIGPARSV